jgi:hypothetical protein
MLVRSDCRALIVSVDLINLARQIIERAPAVEWVLIINGAADA